MLKRWLEMLTRMKCPKNKGRAKSSGGRAFQHTRTHKSDSEQSLRESTSPHPYSNTLFLECREMLVTGFHKYWARHADSTSPSGPPSMWQHISPVSSLFSCPFQSSCCTYSSCSGLNTGYNPHRQRWQVFGLDQLKSAEELWSGNLSSSGIGLCK